MREFESMTAACMAESAEPSRRQKLIFIAAASLFALGCNAPIFVAAMAATARPAYDLVAVAPSGDIYRMDSGLTQDDCRAAVAAGAGSATLSEGDRATVAAGAVLFCEAQ